MQDVVARVLGFLAEIPAGREIGADTELMQQGVLDSTGLVRLILFLESEFRILIADHEITPERFASPSTIAAFVIGKVAA